MRKFIFLVSLFALSAAPLAAHGAQIKFGQPYSLNKGEVLNTNLYFAGQNASVYGNVAGDLTAAGGVIDVGGDVTGSVLAAGGRLNLHGNVGGSIRAAGGNIDIDGTVQGDVVVAGGEINILPTAVIQGDLLLAGGTARVNGQVKGSIRSQARMVTLNGPVGGNVDINVENLSLGDKAAINGNLTYHSYAPADISSAAVVRGATNFDKKTDMGRRGSALGAIFGLGALIKFIVLFLAALILALLFKKSGHGIVRAGMLNVWSKIWRGFVFMIITPILGIILLISVIGAPFGAIVLLAYGISLILATIFAVITAGAWLERWLWKKDAITWRTALLGAAAYVILGWIPFVGWLGDAALFLASLGAVSSYFKAKFADDL